MHIVILLNDSGSMLPAAKATVDAVNAYLGKQAMLTLISLYTYNSRTGVRQRFANVSAFEAPRLFRNNDLFDNPNLNPDLIYAPAGGTMPLRDAIAQVIAR